MEVRDGDFEGGASGNKAVETLGLVLSEREKTKRLLISAACLFFIIAALVIVFAPTEKQNLAYLLGAALMIMALGAIGASRFKFKLPGITVETNSTTQPKPNDESRHNPGQVRQSQGYIPHQSTSPQRDNDGSDTML